MSHSFKPCSYTDTSSLKKINSEEKHNNTNSPDTISISEW